jgi:hypothetical protein
MAIIRDRNSTMKSGVSDELQEVPESHATQRS